MIDGDSRAASAQRTPLHRRQYIVDRPFQHRLIGTLLTIWLANSVFFTIVLYFFYVGHLRQFYDLVPREQFEPLLSLPMLFGLSMAFVYLFGFIVLGIVGMYMSNQIAGPLWRTKKCLERVGQGDYDFRLQFRQSDFLRDIPGIFNAMLDGLGRQRQADLEELEAIERAAENPKELKQLVQKLRERKQSRAGSLQGAGAEADRAPERVTVTIS